jgi:hypothetical protein
MTREAPPGDLEGKILGIAGAEGARARYIMRPRAGEITVELLEATASWAKGARLRIPQDEFAFDPRKEP